MAFDQAARKQPAGWRGRTPEAEAKSDRLSLSGWSWALFEGGRDPYIMLIMAYVFMPYFASIIVGDPVRGQAMVANYAKAGGLIIAVTSPFLGAMVDKLGRRKPVVLSITALTLPLLCSLWWATPGPGGLSATTILLIAAALNILYALSGVAHNSLLVSAAGVHAGRASGIAYMLANAVGMTSLAFVLWAFVLPGKTHWALIPTSPLLGLDAARHEPDRVVSWISAGLLIAGAVPLTLFAKDASATGVTLRESAVMAFGDVATMLRGLVGDRNLSLYLAAHVFIADAISAVTMFLGIYAAGVMKWQVMKLLVFAIFQSAFAALGGLAGGHIDDRVGSKRALQIALVGAMVCTAGVIGMSRETILYLWAFPPERGPQWDLGAFLVTPPEVLFVLLFGGVVFWATVAAGSGRAMILLITSPERSGVSFGLYALSATITAWLGPLLVGAFTSRFHSQQMGFAPIAAFFLLGLGLVTLVRTRPIRQARFRSR